ncbi:MAG: hypothetical protein AUJ57_01775 [Zetaproteobacteria bacterium CG1_02_53_45]|nr:MAG: hypothetical protein AUJ57_01775 [Zetaproteobacteria bacterium CG1_02_53_45]
MSLHAISLKNCGLAMLLVLICYLPGYVPACFAGPAEAYRQALALAAQGQDRAAAASLTVLVEAMPEQQVWGERMQAAHVLIAMRAERQSLLPARSEPNPHLLLASAYAADHTLLPEAGTWPAAALATLMPGAGHAWQGRWRDAGTAALMVWPMLILTLWAARRRMGPVTVFFCTDYALGLVGHRIFIYLAGRAGQC